MTNDTNKSVNDENQDRGLDQATGTELVGHEWDGIAELNTPLPRWWLWSFYGTIIWAIIYVILYPAWPMLNSATEGVLGWSSRSELQQELQSVEESRAPIYAALSEIALADLPNNAELMKTAIEGGRAAFKVHCVQCHGSGGAGSKGYPNLNDDDWLWGGDMDALYYTLNHGIRNPDHPETRASQMPAFGDILDSQDINLLADHVLSLSGKAKSNNKGATLFEQNCAVCHGGSGEGLRNVGAPRLSDSIWLYGDTKADILETIRYSRQGVMPRWNDKLDPVTIKMLSAYVWSLGGGEKPAAANPIIAQSGAALDQAAPLEAISNEAEQNVSEQIGAGN